MLLFLMRFPKKSVGLPKTASVCRNFHRCSTVPLILWKASIPLSTTQHVTFTHGIFYVLSRLCAYSAYLNGHAQFICLWFMQYNRHTLDINSIFYIGSIKSIPPRISDLLQVIAGALLWSCSLESSLVSGSMSRMFHECPSPNEDSSRVNGFHWVSL